jgi:hypothetical protein
MGYIKPIVFGYNVIGSYLAVRRNNRKEEALNNGRTTE